MIRMEIVEEQVVDFNDLVPAPTEVDTLESPLQTDSETVRDSSPDKSRSRSRSSSPAKGNIWFCYLFSVSLWYEVLVKLVWIGTYESSIAAGPEYRGDPNDPRVRLKRDCVAIVAAFRMRDSPNKILILGNAHLYWYVPSLLQWEAYFLSWILILLALQGPRMGWCKAGSSSVPTFSNREIPTECESEAGL